MYIPKEPPKRIPGHSDHICSVTIILNLGIVMYQLNFMPLESKLMNRLEVFNEFMIIVASIHMLLFTNFVPDLED